MTSVCPMYDTVDQEKRENKLDEELKKEHEEDTNIEPDNKFSIEYQRRGKKVLLVAEKGNLLELARLLKDCSSLVNYKDLDGYTPLHRASYGGHKDCAKYLLKHGADINARTNDDWTPLHCAVRWNNIILAEFLINQGADVNAISKGGNTPLHIVASNGRYSVTCDIIQLLLYRPNCDYSIKNDSGDTAFDIARRSGPFYKFWTGVMTLVYDEEKEIAN